MNKSAAEAERDVEQSRGDLDRTVEALKEKMTPGQLLDEATRSMGVAGNQVVSKFIEQAKENPMPLAVMGLGLAWLMTTSNKRSHATATEPRQATAGSFARGWDDGSEAASGQAGDGLIDRMKDVSSGAADAFYHATDKAGDAAGHVRDQVSGAASSAAHSARELTGQAGAMAGAATDKAAALALRGRDTVMDLMDKEPLLIGGAGLLAGLALGAALPPTDSERRYIGPLHDRVVGKTRDLAQGGLDHLSDATHAAYQGVKAELRRAPDGEQPADTADRVVQAGEQAVRDQSATAS